MNCVRCDYLLWDLPENRCPECGSGFEVTDYGFKPNAVHFVCGHCRQPYLGTDLYGLPFPRRFRCVQCGEKLDAASMVVHPLSPDAQGEPLRMGTPWEHRHRVGFVRAFVDGIARLATQPGEYFRLAAGHENHGAMAFSIACAYVASAVMIAAIMLFQRGGLAAWLPDMSKLMRPPMGLIILAAIPFAQIAWNYLYGMLIQAVLWGLGQGGSEYEHSVHAVAFGSAVLPAVFLLPPIGLMWYVAVVASGVEHLNATTRSRAVVATLIPILLAANVGLGVAYALFC